MPPRSTAGCYTCKRRKKKCDETQPFCLRCIRAERQCEGYAPLESPDVKGIMRRGKATPLPKNNTPPRSSNTPESQKDLPTSSPQTEANVSDQQHASSSLTPPPGPSPSPPHPSNAEGPDTLSHLERVPHPATFTQSISPPVEEIPSGLPTPPFESFEPGDAYTDNTFDSLRFFLELRTNASVFPPAFISEVKEEEEESEDDPEGTKQAMCTVPVLDPNTKDNTLPFILECYARWINLVIFEPNKAINPMKDAIIVQFMRSPDERPKMILLANVVGSLGRSLRQDPNVSHWVNYLRFEAYDNINKFLSDPPVSEREMDKKNALAALDLMMEVILIQRYSNSMLTIVKLMEAAAPIFRRACPEPMDQYPNLPNAVMSPSINIRHFATTDIIVSITTGRPLFFRYDCSYSPEMFELIRDGRYGMQWLHGIADEHVVILAHINVLFEEFGTNVSPEHIAEIEAQIREVSTYTERSADPVSTVWRYTVRECWKLTMHIYLYMVLCGASTVHPEVLPRVRSFTRLLDAVTPGRNPDSFLYIPMIIVGASTYRPQDRAVIQRRMFGLQECVNPGSCGYDAMNMLIDVWRRTEAENRPAVWYDLRMAAYRVTGI
ncbi:hypothetical protein RSOLAG1IB_05968 [Rhizoctonia solani AG-1 IB]|uniref:Zn(2)-C6 fungal-type domain-containing protein n=1 Tax=Thanatephorus cucumeris (strain AG1-IB / isolate 7/3/14) TaxID=1108050 RepID=A0A0B7F5S5_THACB|nr:hypothetical protein RSOLAG1IB_05968 [Rhizoctonia solani AG-1 IB]